MNKNNPIVAETTLRTRSGLDEAFKTKVVREALKAEDTQTVKALQISPSQLLLPALFAGQAILRHRSSAQSPQWKEDCSPVTQADLAAHQAASNWLAQAFPHIPVLSEEAALPSPQELQRLSQFWLLDPLDGTSEFIRGHQEYAVSLALVQERRVQAGILAAPQMGVIAWGIVGQGAFHCSLSPEQWLEASPPELLPTLIAQATPLRHTPTSPQSPGLRVLCSRSHDDSATQAHIAQLPNACPQQVGACLKFLHLALGLADYYPRLRSLNEWDIAGGHALLKAAGGNLYEFGTRQELRYGNPGLLAPPFQAY